MFNHSVNKSRAPDPDGNSPYGFTDQPWPKFGGNTLATSSTDPSQSSYNTRPSYTSTLEMDWTSTPSDIQTTRYPQQGTALDNVQLDNMNPPQGGSAGVGRLVAHFENKGFAPPLPPRPSNNVNSQVNSSQAMSSPFGGFNVAMPNVASPLASPNDSNYGLMGNLSRVASPIASPPPMAFGGFYDASRVSSPGMDLAAGPFGSMDGFTMDNRVASPLSTSQMVTSPIITSPMVTSPSPAGPGVPGTPGFAIWRPPVPMTPKPVMDQSQVSNNADNSGGYFKPPVPSTPKPVMNAGSQFILDFNANPKSKGKAPARPPAKQPSRQPSKQQLAVSTHNVFTQPSHPNLQPLPTPQAAETAAASSSSTSFPVR